jgi:hypothetical protein
MTANEMLSRLVQRIDKLTSNSTPWFEDSELSIALSLAQDEYVNSTYYPKGNKYMLGFEASEKRRKDLANLMKNVRINYTNSQWILQYSDNTFEIIDDTNGFALDSSIVKPHGSLWKLPKDFQWSIQEELTWDVPLTDCYSDLRIPISVVTHDEYNTWVRNLFKKPFAELVWRMDYSPEFNANTAIDVTSNTSNLWYRVILPTPENSTAYNLVVNGTTYTYTTDSSATQAELIAGITGLLTADNIQYTVSNNILYILSSSTVTTNQVTVLIKISYLPVEGINSLNQSIISTDNKTHELITDGTMDILYYYIRYIKRPRAIVCDTNNPSNQIHCELNDSTHNDIIEIAARKLYSTLQDPRLQAQIMEEQQSE